MEKWLLLLLALLNLKASAQVQLDSWIRIDCGTSASTSTNGVLWQTDEAFIKTGTNHPIPNDRLMPLAILNTLRAFTQQNKNCYTLPALTNTRYFVRAVFFYANYDGLNDPPTFDLQIDGNKWVTVVSSSTEVHYYEVLYRCQRPSISVCLAQTQKDQFPFISSLEAWLIPDTMYTEMSQDLAWLNSYRYNYGANNWIVGYPGDTNNRIWEPMSVTGAINTTADPGTAIGFSNEQPPDSAILDAVEAQSETTSLFLTFGTAKTTTTTTTTIYVEAYFTEMQLLSTGTRSFDMYVDGKKQVKIIPVYSTCTAAWALVQSLTSNSTIELRPTANTLLPPIISAIEIYTASDTLVTTGNPNVDASAKDKSSTAMIIGLAVGIPLVVIVLILALVFWLIQRRAKQGQNQATEGPEMENGIEHESFTISASTDQLIRPPPRPTAPMKPAAEDDDNEDCIPVTMSNGKPNNETMVPDMELDELEELIHQHEKACSHDNADQLTSDEDCEAVGPDHQCGTNASNGQSMVPDLDLEELDEIIRHQKDRT